MKGPALGLNRPLLRRDRAQTLALGTALLFSQFLSLPRGRFLQRAGGQPLGSGVGHLLHLRQIHVQSGALLAKCMANDNFPPLLGEPGDSLQFFGRELPCCHDIAILDLTVIRQGEFPSDYVTCLSLPRKVRPALVGR